MTLSRQERDHPTSSSSSSTSPTTTVLSDSETRERKDLSGIDSYPVSVSSEHVGRKERGDPLTMPTKNPQPNKNNDISPVPVSNLVDDRSGQPEEIQANEIPKTNKKETTIERRNPL